MLGLITLPPALQSALAPLHTPCAVQAFLDSMPYIGEDRNRSALAVVQDHQCHCLDGGLLGALALWQLGFPPLLVDLIPEPGTDDDHVLAIYEVDGCLGAVAKSNFGGLRYREPVYRSLRELVMSYFEPFFNIERQRTLRAFTRPLNLARFDALRWWEDEGNTAVVCQALYARKGIPVITPAQVSRLTPLDDRSFETNMLGVNLDGLYKGHKG
jgi:hypothetical protein